MLKGPYLDSLKVEDALELFNRGGPIPFPNPQARRNLVHLHDLTHILTRYDVDWVGEGEIANWEIASGLLGKSLLGLFISPQKMLVAFRKGRRQRSVYDLEIPRDQLMKMALSDVRSLIKA